MLNAQQILSEQLLKLESTKGKAAQVGYDLSLKQVNKIGTRIAGPFSWAGTGEIGYVLKNRTIINKYTTVSTIQHVPKGAEEPVEGWLLEVGTYDLVFNEGCRIPDNRVAFIKQRSSLWRNGVLINSPVFDPGFETDNMGTTMLVTEPIFIEKDARVAQIYFHECESAEKYNGQFQYDRQRYLSNIKTDPITGGVTGSLTITGSDSTQVEAPRYIQQKLPLIFND